jgi:hypothetical protein
MARGTWGGALDANIFKVNFRFYMGASKCQFGFKLRDAVTNDNSAQEVADQVRSVAADPFRALIPAVDGLEGIDVIRLGSEEGGWSPQALQAGTLGAAGENELPNFTSVAVTLKSEIRKRYGQGRFFLPLCVNSDKAGNNLQAAGVTRIQTFLDVLSDNFTGAPETHDLILVNAHPLLPARGVIGGSGYRPEIPASWYDVVSLRINSLVTSLRSRKAGVGS